MLIAPFNLNLFKALPPFKGLNSTLPNEKLRVTLEGCEDRQRSIYYDNKSNLLNLPIYTQEDKSIAGKVHINFGGKTRKHFGIFIQLIGEIETFHKLDQKETFLLKSYELEPAGEMKGEMVYSFDFTQFEKKYETFYGQSGRIRYFVCAVICRDMKPSIKSCYEFAVQLPLLTQVAKQGYEIELRIADYLMIDVQLNDTNFDLDECLIGKVTIEKIRLHIKRIQISLIKREIFNPTHDVTCTKEDIITKLELAERCPKKDEIIPFKLSLGMLNLSPNVRNNMKLLIRYMLVISFIDSDDRSLFKPIELNLYRK